MSTQKKQKPTKPTKQMIKSISILIPVHNGKCYALVKKLHDLCDTAEGLDYEIIAADDGSRDQVSVISNLRINEIDHCRYIRRTENVGRAKIRNFLASEAKHDWLLFIDCDVRIVSDNFIRDYLNPQADVVSGRTVIIPSPDPHNLRSRYEVEWATRYDAQKLNEQPYDKFLTTNFLCRRSVFDVCRFDERYTTYGFEDVAFGIALKKNNISIVHITNPVGLDHFETNERYMQKIEQSMHTLRAHADELRGHSPVLAIVERMQSMHLQWLLRLWQRLFGHAIRRILVKHSPSLTLLKIYKIGFFSTLKA